jgi:hypothetical protein
MTKAATADLTDLFLMAKEAIEKGMPFNEAMQCIENMAYARLSKYGRTPQGGCRRDGMKACIETEERCWFIRMEFADWLKNIADARKKGG